jgi:ComF family protein
MAQARQLIGGLRRLGAAGLDLLFPPVCAGCKMPGHAFCPNCAQAVTPVPLPICELCGKSQVAPTARCAACRARPHGAPALSRAAALHTPPLRQAIHALKYEQRPELAALLARYLVAVFAAPPWERLAPAIDAVVPVPLHAERVAERGYNQSELLAAAFCARVGLACEPGWLVRTRATRQQIDLGPAERWSNVAGAFTAGHEVAGRTLLLVDDVYTTGATLRASAAAAQAAGARTVYGLALAMPLHLD